MAHLSRLAGHPGVARSLFLIRQQVWWPSITHATRRFVTTCSVCVGAKSLHQALARLLHSFHTSRLPRSHITIDFVMGLPPSETITVAYNSRPLHTSPKVCICSRDGSLVSALVSPPRYPQFTSRVWRSFCAALAASVSFSSGYRPQTNGQTEQGNQSLAARHPLPAANTNLRLSMPKNLVSSTSWFPQRWVTKATVSSQGVSIIA